jgi:hypothetical protein
MVGKRAGDDSQEVDVRQFTPTTRGSQSSRSGTPDLRPIASRISGTQPQE